MRDGTRLDELHRQVSGAMQTLIACSEHADLPREAVVRLAGILTRAHEELATSRIPIHEVYLFRVSGGHDDEAPCAASDCTDEAVRRRVDKLIANSRRIVRYTRNRLGETLNAECWTERGTSREKGGCTTSSEQLSNGVLQQFPSYLVRPFDKSHGTGWMPFSGVSRKVALIKS